MGDSSTDSFLFVNPFVRLVSDGKLQICTEPFCDGISGGYSHRCGANRTCCLYAGAPPSPDLSDQFELPERILVIFSNPNKQCSLRLSLLGLCSTMLSQLDPFCLSQPMSIVWKAGGHGEPNSILQAMKDWLDLELTFTIYKTVSLWYVG